MVAEQIEKIKQEYTDKYVEVDATRPELARFRNVVGQVKTVNMSGRALVEFLDYHQNIGWYDIDLDFLKVVDKPAPKEKEAAKKPAAKAPAKKPAAAPAGEKKLSPLEMARMQGASGKAAPAKPAADTGKQSTADILAAARGGAKPAAKAETPAEKPDTPAAKSDASAKVDRSKMSVADMLAAARGGDAPAAKDEPAPEPAEAAAAPEPEVEAPTSEPASSGEVVRVDRSTMSIDEMLAYCREHDAG